MIGDGGGDGNVIRRAARTTGNGFQNRFRNKDRRAAAAGIAGEYGIADDLPTEIQCDGIARHGTGWQCDVDDCAIGCFALADAAAAFGN